jgi:hypothetical protein
MPIKQFSRVEVVNNPYGLQLQSRTGTVIWADTYDMYVVRLDQPALGRDDYGQPTWYPEIREHFKSLAVISEPQDQ